jgi:hypothetical protein
MPSPMTLTNSNAGDLVAKIETLVNLTVQLREKPFR